MAKKNAVDREFAKIAAAQPVQPLSGDKAALDMCSACTNSPYGLACEHRARCEKTYGLAPAPSASPASDVAVRPKTLTELTAEYEQAAQEGRSCAEALNILERELSDTRKRFEAACARRAAVWRAIEQIHSAEA